MGYLQHRKRPIWNPYRVLFVLYDEHMSASSLQEVHDAALDVVNELAPAERFSFEGIWSDTVSGLGSAEDQVHGLPFAMPADGAQLWSVVIVPACLWLAKKLAEGTVAAASGAVKEWIKAQFQRSPKNTNHLSDADLERIANAVARRLAKSR
jgi:hypothetical protein